MKQRIRLVCTEDFKVYNHDRTILKGEFKENEMYIATLNEFTEEYFIYSREGSEIEVAYYDNEDKLIIEEGFELLE